MSVKKTPGGQMNRDRYAELKRILEERRREILSAVHEKIRDVRTEGANSPTHGVLDAAESSEADIQDDIEFALIQMKAETLTQDRGGPAPSRGGHVRLLLRVWRGNLRAPAARAAVRGSLQGLRRGAGSGPAARAHAAAARLGGTLPRHAGVSLHIAPGLPPHGGSHPGAERATFRRLDRGSPPGPGPRPSQSVSSVSGGPERPPHEEDRS